MPAGAINIKIWVRTQCLETGQELRRGADGGLLIIVVFCPPSCDQLNPADGSQSRTPKLPKTTKAAQAGTNAKQKANDYPSRFLFGALVKWSPAGFRRSSRGGE
jgi:hypothetical protein